jgi:hypothetical protein
VIQQCCIDFINYQVQNRLHVGQLSNSFEKEAIYDIDFE